MITKTIAYTSIDDNCIISGGEAGNNYGSFTFIDVGYISTLTCRGLLRLDKTQIPSGTISAFRLFIYQTIAAWATVPFTINAYKVLANAWVEGTKVGEAENGSSCWSYAQTSGVAWAGSVGCGTSGADYEADASPPHYHIDQVSPTGLAGWRQLDLTPAWATQWRDGIVANNGILLMSDDEATAGKGTWFNSTDAVSAQPYFEIDYTNTTSNKLVYFRSPF